jgi:hypothetical protein
MVHGPSIEMTRSLALPFPEHVMIESPPTTEVRHKSLAGKSFHEEVVADLAERHSNNTRSLLTWKLFVSLGLLITKTR